MEETLSSADEKIALIQSVIKKYDDEIKHMREENNLIIEELNKLCGTKDIDRDFNKKL